LIARLSKEFIEKFNSVVLFNPDVGSLAAYVKTIRQIEKDKKIVIIWEEFDSIVNQDEAELLCLLDGEIQAENIVYLATTNYISDIPARIKNRPSRFSIVQEISLPSKDTRHAYFDYKLKTKEDKEKYLGAFVDASEGFTIDQCKDLIVSTLLFNLSISEAVMKLKSMERDHDMGQDDYNEEMKREIFQTKKNKNDKPIKGLR
jgi:SpoVK/Ycf46/Vps4 family AAA+-type ATPase